MKHLKVYEADIEYFDSYFYFLKSLENSKESIEFLKSLDLTEEQYSKLSEIMEDYARERYDDGCYNEYSE